VTKWIPRTVTYGLAGLTLAVCAFKVEAWPLTSAHMFTSISTEEQVKLELVAVGKDANRAPISPGETEVLEFTEFLYPDLPDQNPQRQHEMVSAWLEVAKIPAEDVKSVVLERVWLEMGETSADWTEFEREQVWELQL